MNETTLRGIDGSNPLGLLASLGTLRVLSEMRPSANVRLAWHNDGYWRPVVFGIRDAEEIVGTVMEDLPSWENEPALTLAYIKEGDGAGRRVEPDTAGAIRDLKPPAAVQRALFEKAAHMAGGGQRRTARLLACFGTDVALDNSKFIKPTALHFTAGQQQFLKMVGELRDGIGAHDIRSALEGPWTYDSKLPSLSWSGTGQRMWALRASDPSKDKRGSCPGAEWLAFIGLSFFPCVPRGQRVETTGVRGHWKNCDFTWPLWTAPARPRVVSSLLQTRGLEELKSHERRARRIGAVFKATIHRSEQGGYGSFAPASSV